MKTILLIILTSIGIQLSAQQWTANLPKDKTEKELTFYDYQDAFYSYWAPYNLGRNGYYMENGVKKKAVGWKQFKRWEWSMKGQIDNKTGQFPQKSAQKTYTEYLRSQHHKSNSRSANWTNLGTNSSDGGYAGIGRLEAVAFHPTDNDTYWVGAPAGGLWRTTDNGNSWTCLTDDNDVLGVSDIIIPTDYEASHTIYIATGDRDESHNYSIGVLKSTDSGATWNTTDLTYNIGANERVYRLIVDPNDNQTILAATSNGIYKTTNGGTNWDNQISPTRFNDLEAKPTDFNTLYASTSNGFIHVTTNGGTNWTTSVDYGRRVELAVTPDDDSYVYAIVCQADEGLQSILKSTNSGTSFAIVFDGNDANHNLLGWETDGSDAGGQGSYDLCIEVSPTNADKVIIGGVNVWHSVNGGATFSPLTSWSGTQNGTQEVHADQHMLNYRTNGDLFLCNDGGIYLSTNDGAEFIDKTDGIVISQMYKIGASQLNSAEIINGLQDNGTKLLSGGAWTDVVGGDGMECIIDYTNDDIQYGSNENGSIVRTTTHWGFDSDITPGGAGQGSWVTPYIIHPVDHNTLYAGYSDVWKTTNKGNTWNKISTINTNFLLESMAISSDGGALYVADIEKIWKSTNDGGAWTNITNNLPGNNIMSIAIKDGDANVVWVTLGAYDNNGVYESTDGGNSWHNISAGLPALPVYTIVQNKQATLSNHLYVGTQLGVYYKKGGDNWIPYNDGLPNVRIGELEIYYDAVTAQSSLKAGTFGRGLWESNLELENLDEAAVMTTSVTTLTSTTAEVGGNVLNEGTSAVSERGIVWSLTPNPTTANNKIIDGAVGTGTYTATINGLANNTTYYYRAYAINNNGISYGNDISFKTLCGAMINFPFTEGFEGGILPVCWSYEGIDWTYENGGFGSNNPANAHSGSFNALFYNPSTTPKVSKLVTPPFDFGVETMAILKFWHTQKDFTGDQDELRVYYKTSFAGGWTLLETYTNNITSWTEETIALPNLSNNYFIAFEATGKYGHGVTIDDVNVSVGIPPCVICASAGTTTYNTSTTLVNINTINNVTAKPAGYNDYRSISTDLKVDNSYDLTINLNTGGDYITQSKVWIDWNQDCDFDDAGESYSLGSVNNNPNGATSASPLNITVPNNAILGNTVMRVSCKYNIEPTSCETGFDGEVEDYTINVIPSAPVPIELVYFTAEANESNKVLLKWKTENEIDNDYFTIQRMKDGIDWQDIIEINASGKGRGEYVSIDDHPFGGNSYYRLKQTDNTGIYSYSDIAPVNISSDNLAIFPNPTTKLITIVGNDNELSKANIFNTLGQDVGNLVKSIKTQHGILELDLSSLPSGIYFIKSMTKTSIVYKE